MDKKQYDSIDWGLKPLHNKMLELLLWIDSFCKENKIEYSLAYGSVLGAVRHKGFIPWDDDADIYMTSESYEKFRESFKKIEGTNCEYLLQEIEAIDGMCTISKIRINNTTFIEPLFKNSDIHQGIYIDIFILHNAPSNKIQRRIMCLFNQYLVLKSLSNRRYKRSKYNIIFNFLRLFPTDFLRKFSLKQIYKYDNLESDCFFDVDLRVYKKSFFSKDLIFPSVEMEFENVKLMVPQKATEYLEYIYGDYMTTVSYEKAVESQHAEVWDVNKDYKEYLD